ncbi:MAG: SdpI family protein [candidate division WOR-3 bacterium]
MKKIEFLVSFITGFAFLMSLYFYNSLPDVMETHWDYLGNPDGYMRKLPALFFIPSIMILLNLLFFAIPKIDPLKENIKKFRKYYYIFILVFSIFMVVLHSHLILWNIGIKIHTNSIMSVSFALLFFYIGVLLENTKRNWFIGIRTPWTLSSDEVWEKTHRIGSKMFKISSLFCIIGFFIKDYAVLFILLPVIFSAAYCVVYSYVIYKKSK